MKVEDKWILAYADDDHNCEPNRPRVVAELLRHRMKELVRKDPCRAVGKAVRTIRVEAAEEYSGDKEFYQHLVAELGTDSALERQMLRVRAELIGSTPKSRNMFDPEKFLTNVFGDKNKVIVCDSNKLSDGWRDEIAKSNRNSEYNWHNLTQDMLNLEEYNHGDITEHVADLDDDLDFEELANKDLPKRVLAFSSKLLLEQLSKKLKTSVDGTFKSSCALWGQMFVWMVKADGYWIPTVFGWLPDKSEDSYKVFFHLVREKMKELRLDLEVESVLCA